MYKIAICLCALVAALTAAPQDRSPTDQSYVLPMDFDTLLYSPLSLAFSCLGRNYGYFADINNNCQIFHICLPIRDEYDAIIDMFSWSFICGNGTVFDQATLTCNYAQDSIPCGDSESFYGAVPFGIVDSPAFV